MRRLIPFAGLLVPMLLPGAALAGNCPSPGGAVVDKESYRPGQMVEFFGTYHDFADPGTVTITFERTTDGTIREFTAFNMPDGAWIYQLTFDADFTGRWDVTVVVDQTSALDTCRDRVTIRSASSLPNTATADNAAAPVDIDGGLLLVLLGLGSVTLALGRDYGSRSKART